MKAKSRILSLALSAVMLAAMCFAIPVQLTAQASNGITSVVFDYTDGESNVWNGVSGADQPKTKTVEVSGDTVTAVSDSKILNLIGWKNGGNVYSANEEIPVAQLIADSNGTTATLTPVFGEYSLDYSDLAVDYMWSTDTNGTGAGVVAKDDDQGNHFKATVATNGKSRGVALTDQTSSFANYNKGTTYKVTLKYKTSGAANIQLWFGMPVKNGNGSSGAGFVSRETLVTTTGKVGQWTEKTAYVTAPDTYHVTQYYLNNDLTTMNDYSRVIGIGYTDVNPNTVIYVDDITVKPVYNVSYSYGGAKAGTDEQKTYDDYNFTLPEKTSVMNLFWKNGEKIFAAGSEVSIADLTPEADGTYKFSAHFGAASIDYNDITNGFKFYNDTVYTDGNIRSYGTGDASIESGTLKVFKRTSIGYALLWQYTDVVDKMVYFTPGEEYYVAFKYKSNVSVTASLGFGLATDWHCGNTVDNDVTLGSLPAATNWTDASFTITAPKAYGTNSARVALGFIQTESNGTTYFDDVLFIPVGDKVTVNYDFGDSATIGDMETQTVDKTGEIDLKFPTKSDIINLTGWKYGKKVFDANETVTAADLADSEGNIPSEVTLTAVYGAATFNFENSTVGEESEYMGSGAFSIAGDDTNKTLKIDANTSAHRRFALTNNDRVTGFATYNKGQAYKVTFNYSSEIKDDYYGQITIGYGQSYLNHVCWRNTSSSIEYTVVEKVSEDVSNKTVTAIVTAPNTYYNGGCIDHPNTDVYASYFSIGILSNTASEQQGNVIIYVDDITITPVSVSSAQVSDYALFTNPTEGDLFDLQGNTMNSYSVVYKNKAGSERTAFRFLSSFKYYTNDTKDTDDTVMYLDEDMTMEIVSRGMKVGKYDGKNYTQMADSTADPSAAAWSDEDSTLTYSFKLYNISAANMEVVYYATPYLIVTVGDEDEPIYVYGATKTTSVQDLFDKFSVAATTPDTEVYNEAWVEALKNAWYPGVTVNSTDFMHISFDDVEICFNNLASGDYNSLWDEPFFGWLKEMHDDAGAVFSLYAYANALEDVPATYANDFYEARDWLKIGLHAEKSGSTYSNYTEEQGKDAWEAFVADVYAITGTYDSIDTMPRLHYFAGSEAALKGMSKASDKPATGFLSADDSRISYYFTEEIRDYLYDNDYITDNVNNLVFVATDLRGDWFDGTKSDYTFKKPVTKTVYDELKYRYTDSSFANSRGSYIFFTHEWKVYEGTTLNDSKKTWVEDAVRFAKGNDLRFAFPMNETFSETDYDITTEVK